MLLVVTYLRRPLAAVEGSAAHIREFPNQGSGGKGNGDVVRADGTGVLRLRSE
jgi:hypothetical protein